MPPATQGLGPDSQSRLEIDDWLQERGHRSSADRGAQLVGHHRPSIEFQPHRRVEDRRPAPPIGLGSKQGGVGEAQEIAGRRVTVGDGDTDARADRQWTVRNHDGSIEGGEHAAGALCGGASCAEVDDGDELIATHAGEHLIVIERPQQSIGDRLEQRVADGVPEGVVDELETVEVQEHHADGPRCRLGPEGVFECLHERRSVREAGEAVVGRFELQPIVERLQVRCGVAKGGALRLEALRQSAVLDAEGRGFNVVGPADGPEHSAEPGGVQHEAAGDESDGPVGVHDEPDQGGGREGQKEREEQRPDRTGEHGVARQHPERHGPDEHLPFGRVGHGDDREEGP